MKSENLILRKSNDSPTMMSDCSVPPRILGSILMPESTVYFQGDLSGRNCKVNERSSDWIFLNEFNTQTREAFPHFCFKTCFSPKFSVTSFVAKRAWRLSCPMTAAIWMRGSRLMNCQHLPARLALECRRSRNAFCRTMDTFLSSLSRESLSACRTRQIHRLHRATCQTAHVEPIRNRIRNTKGLLTDWADFLDQLRPPTFFVAGARAPLPRMTRMSALQLEYLAAFSACEIRKLSRVFVIATGGAVERIRSP